LTYLVSNTNTHSDGRRHARVVEFTPLVAGYALEFDDMEVIPPTATSKAMLSTAGHSAPADFVYEVLEVMAAGFGMTAEEFLELEIVMRLLSEFNEPPSKPRDAHARARGALLRVFTVLAGVHLGFRCDKTGSPAPRRPVELDASIRLVCRCEDVVEPVDVPLCDEQLLTVTSRSAVVFGEYDIADLGVEPANRAPRHRVHVTRFFSVGIGTAGLCLPRPRASVFSGTGRRGNHNT
jgi:hypothetical protein